MGALRAVRIIVSVAAITAVLLIPQLMALALRHRWRDTIPVLWHRLIARVLSLKIHFHGTVAKGGHGTLLAANHVSWLDIVALGSAEPLSFIAKDDVRSWPFFGQLAQLQRTVFVSRERKMTVRHQADAIRNRLDHGDTLVLFPEGTTSDGNFVYPFKSSLFGAVGITGTNAGNHRIVQPVAITYTHWHGQPMGRYDRPIAAWPGDIELLPHLKRILLEGVLDVDVVFGTPIEITPDVDRKMLTAMTESQVRSMVSASLRGRLPPSKMR